MRRGSNRPQSRAPQEILTALMEGTARATGPAFFSSLVEQLASVLDAR
jgi:hypothetical protein